MQIKIKRILLIVTLIVVLAPQSVYAGSWYWYRDAPSDYTVISEIKVSTTETSAYVSLRNRYYGYNEYNWAHYDNRLVYNFSSIEQPYSILDAGTLPYGSRTTQQHPSGQVLLPNGVGFSNLQPNKKYYIYVKNWYEGSFSSGSWDEYGNYYPGSYYSYDTQPYNGPFYHPYIGILYPGDPGYPEQMYNYGNRQLSFATDLVAATTPTYSEIGPTYAIVSWTKGTNYEVPSYTVQMRVKKQVPDAWQTVYTGYGHSVQVENLGFNTKYEFQVIATGIGNNGGNGSPLTRTSPISYMQTSTDPAVAAAVAAQSAAEASMLASENAKTAAINAEASSEQTRVKMVELQSKVDKIPTDSIAPTVSVALASNKSITTSASETVYADATDNISLPNQISYRVGVNNLAPTEWQVVPVNGEIVVNLPITGLCKIKLWFKDLVGNITLKELRIWRK